MALKRPSPRPPKSPSRPQSSAATEATQAEATPTPAEAHLDGSPPSPSHPGGSPPRRRPTSAEAHLGGGPRGSRPSRSDPSRSDPRPSKRKPPRSPEAPKPRSHRCPRAAAVPAAIEANNRHSSGRAEARNRCAPRRPGQALEATPPRHRRSPAPQRPCRRRSLAALQPQKVPKPSKPSKPPKPPEPPEPPPNRERPGCQTPPDPGGHPPCQSTGIHRQGDRCRSCLWTTGQAVDNRPHAQPKCRPPLQDWKPGAGGQPLPKDCSPTAHEAGEHR